MGKVIRYNGVVEDVTPVNGTDYELEQLNLIVGGYIQVVHSLAEGDDRVMVVDEDGKMKDKYLNRRATKLLVEQFGYKNDYIVGDVLVCHDYEIK